MTDAPIHRNQLPEAIEALLNTTDASHVSITLSAADARLLAKDIRWTRKTTVNFYSVEKLVGERRCA